jgi:hypothetical protein
MGKLQTYKYTWQMLSEDVETILTLVDFDDYDMLVGVASGGLPLLTSLVNATKLPYEIIKCKSYKGKEQLELKTDFLELEKWGYAKKILLVDDVSDTGKTLDFIKNKLKERDMEVEILTLCWKPHSIVTPKWYLHEVNNDIWINFNWE